MIWDVNSMVFMCGASATRFVRLASLRVVSVYPPV